MSDLLEHLQKLQKSDEYPFHMPGHKRNFGSDFMDNPYGIDITEIEGYDNLYEADGILADAMKRAAKVCGAEETFFLVNGSTVGLLAAITGVTNPGDRILVARNCHKAVFHAMELRQLQAVYLHPEYVEDWDLLGGINPQEVFQKLERYPDIKAVVITSPTYDGIVSPVKEIAGIVHEAGIPLIVDEAHGAHFPHDERFPESAIQSGADVVVQSMHKTLPSFTQTALLHMKKGFADVDRIREYIGFYQTSSPSYLFMAGMDKCMELIEKQGSHLWDEFFCLRDDFFEKIKGLDYIRIYTDNEPGKLVISVKNTGMTGRELHERLLQDYQIQMEMAAESYVLGIITMCDTKEGFGRLAEALVTIDKELAAFGVQRRNIEEAAQLQRPNKDSFQSSEIVKNVFAETFMCEDVVYSLAEIRQIKKEEMSFKEAEGRVSGDYVNLYPPGIPFLIPGERITKDHISLIQGYLAKRLHVQGISNGNIWVCCHNEE